MPNYTRLKIEGGSYFFTVALLNRRSDLLVKQVESLRQAVRRVRAAKPFRIDAWVVLPDHHALRVDAAGGRQRLLYALARYQDGFFTIDAEVREF